MKNRETSKSLYLEKLKDPRWQKKRLEIFERDNWTCKSCNDRNSTLNVHHLIYHRDLEPWEYPNEDCHNEETEFRNILENEFLYFTRTTFSIGGLRSLFIFLKQSKQNHTLIKFMNNLGNIDDAT